MMEIIQLLKQIAPTIAFVGAITLIQISPLQINPWSWFAKMFRRFNGIEGVSEKIEEVEKKVDNIELKFDTQIASVERDNARTRAKVIRKEIIDFAEELKRGKKYSVAEFEEVGRLINEYNDIIKEYGFKNAYCTSQMEYIQNYTKGDY